MVNETRPPATKPVRQPVRTKIGGVALMVAGVAVALYGFIKLNLFIRVLQDLFERDDQASFFEALGLVMLAYAGILFGRHLCAPDAKDVMARDSRPPILFLRPFAEDRRVVQSSPVGAREGGERTKKSTKDSDIEPMLVRMFKPVGPFVAVGRPGEGLAHLGAARLYVSHEEWMNTVQDLVHRAAAVVLQPEFSSGTLWEVQLVVKAVDLQRLLLIVPGPHLRPLRFIRVCELVQERFGITLPTVEDCPPCDAFYFEHGKTPIPLRLDKQILDTAKPFLDHLRALGDPRTANA
jgi:hypothetical protein